MPKNGSEVRFARHEHWVELVLNRPDRANAFNDAMHELLLGFVREAADDDGCRALLITGAGRHFCAGQDLGDRDPRSANWPPDLERSLKERYNPLVRTLREMPKPVVCAVNGVAAGAGVGLALACDIVLASERSAFAFAFSKVGLIPDAGTSWHVARALGEARAKFLLMTGGKLTASEAASAGLVSAVYADDELDARARTLAETLANGPTTGLGLTKQAVHSAFALDFAEQLDMEARLQGEAGRTCDYAEGVLAFLEKRAPRFSGN